MLVLENKEENNRMINFLLRRPIAVLMAFAGLCIVGFVTYFLLPVSLLPDIDIPQITVQVSGENTSARELENTVVALVRRQLLQVGGLQEIKSETRDNVGIIRMTFDFGTNTDLAFIEVNEKIDGAMNKLPREVKRPKVIKASVTDVPVLYINMALKQGVPFGHTDMSAFLDMCQIADNVVRRRIEQLPEVAMVDVTGFPKKVLQIVTNQEKMAMAGITIVDLERALVANNVQPGSMVVKDGYYEYNIRIATLLRTPEDVENIYIRKGIRIFQLKDLCQVEVVAKQESGISLVQGKRAVTMAVIKQSDENMDHMRKQLKETLSHFTAMYPEITFSVVRNQTELLDFTISNLQQNLLWGLVLVFFISIFFLGDIRSPLVIAISMVASIVITFLFFYFFHVSLNIISLAGLIMAVGMMIDSAIIVTENISQYRECDYPLLNACVLGTSEMITPMLSSGLTTIAVFFPLVFLSGIAGSIFKDQAFAISVGLLVSYVTGIILLPVLYLLFYRANVYRRSLFTQKFGHLLKNQWLERFYDKGIVWVFGHKTVSLVSIVVMIPLCVLFFYMLDKERMPQIEQSELVVQIDWNENIHIDENQRRVNELMQATANQVQEYTAYVGLQDFILDRENALSVAEAELYFKAKKTLDVVSLKRQLYKQIAQVYPSAIVTFLPPENIFEKLFVTGEADLVAQLHTKNKVEEPSVENLKALQKTIQKSTCLATEELAFNKQINIFVDRSKLLLYNVSYSALNRVLRTAFKNNKVSTLHSFQQYLPISIAGSQKTVEQVLHETFVRTTSDNNGQVYEIPISQLVSVHTSEGLKNITAGKNGEYIPIVFFEVKHVPQTIEAVQKVVKDDSQWDVQFGGRFFDNKEMMNELLVILLISVMLMYFILCAQFESFLQPLIVLIEIPIATAFALITLWFFGYTLNLMSAIGIIVTCGIVINDSILKLDAINELQKNGMPLYDAIHTAGHKRLRAIIMTSLTTVFAMVPLLFTSDMGSELQRPLSVAIISSMVLGTLVSLFVVPLLYWLIYRKIEKK